MSLDLTLARVNEIHSMLGTTPSAPAAAPPASGSVTPTAFARQLQSATASAASPQAIGPTAAGGAARTRVATAAGEIGVREQPPGSNDAPRIAEYRSAMPANPGVGPWCAYFVSWVAKQAGTPLGDRGEGFAAVDAAYAWAKRSGRALDNTGATPARPQPGDLIVWDEHIGLVESVDPDGRVHTIEGNTSDSVARRSYDARDALGYIRMS